MLKFWSYIKKIYYNKTVKSRLSYLLPDACKSLSKNLRRDVKISTPVERASESCMFTSVMSGEIYSKFNEISLIILQNGTKYC